MLDLNGILLSIITFECFLFGIYAFLHKENCHKSHKILGALFLCHGFNTLDNILQILQLSSFSLIFNLVITLVPGLIYFYVRMVSEADFKWRKIDLWHLSPFVVFVGIVLFGFHLQPEAIKEAIILGQNSNSIIDSPFLALGLHLLVFVYMYFSWRLIVQYNEKIRTHFSTVEALDLSWLKFLLLGYSASWIISLTFNGLVIIGLLEPARFVVHIQTGWTLFFINALIFKVFVRHDIVQYLSKPIKNLPSGKRLSIDPIPFGKQLTKFLESEKPFLISDLTIEDLAESLGIPTKELSIYLNEICGQNFYDFINSQRINYAKEMLVGQPNMPVTETIYACGFNSKSSFNSSFKRYTGQTPSQYRLQNQP